MTGCNPHTSRLKQSILQNSQGSALLQEGYTYDVLGNVDRRSQYWNSSGYSEGFAAQMFADIIFHRRNRNRSCLFYARNAQKWLLGLKKIPPGVYLKVLYL